MNVSILVPPGELTDKITILEIKSRRVKDKNKLSTVREDLRLLKSSLAGLLNEHKNKAVKFRTLKKKLYNINVQLWDIENVIRALEDKKDFGKKFVETARAVYITNDKRSAVKNEINSLFGSSLREVKQYSKYKQAK